MPRATILAAGALSLFACKPPAPLAAGARTDAAFDPHFATTDRDAPYTRFDGKGGSLRLGSGWWPSETNRQGVATAWGMRDEAEFFVDRPPGGPWDLYLNAYAYDYEGAPQQTTTLLVNDREVGRTSLDGEWRRARIPVEAEDLRPGTNRCVLRFAYSVRPRDVSESNDGRELSANFLELALVPRGWQEPTDAFERVRLDPERSTVRLGGGAGYVLPLPAARRVAVHLARVTPSDEDAELAIELLAPDGSRSRVWSGTGRQRDLRVGAKLAPGAPARLELRSLAAPDEDTLIELPPDFLSFAERSPDAATPPPIFVYMVDTLRADALEVYGSARPTSPAVTAFARDAVVYEQAWTPSSWTLPAVVSLMTGVYPFAHGIMTGRERFSDERLASLPGMLAEAGYATFGASHSFVAGPEFGLDAGFGTFVLNSQLNGWSQRSQEMRRHVSTWLSQRPDPARPPFVYVHTVDPHGPYAPLHGEHAFEDEAPRGKLPPGHYATHRFKTTEATEDPAELAYLRAKYDGEVLHMDREFGRFMEMLKHLGLYESSVIALVSDHGEEFAEHGGFDHGRTVYEEMLRVPLVVKYPGSEWGGQRVAVRVSTLDLTATLLSLATGGEGAYAVSGRSLLPPELDAAGRIVFSQVSPLASEHAGAVDYKAVAYGALKGIFSATEVDQFGQAVPRWRAFDLALDAGERSPIAPDDPRAEATWSAMQRWIEAAERAAASPGVHDLEDEDLRDDMLKQLGYR